MVANRVWTTDRSLAKSSTIDWSALAAHDGGEVRGDRHPWVPSAKLVEEIEDSEAVPERVRKSSRP